MKEVIVYSKPGCSKCVMLKKWLGVKSIEFSETDITQDEESFNKIVSLNRTSLPQLEIDGEFVDYKEFNDILVEL